MRLKIRDGAKSRLLLGINTAMKIFVSCEWRYDKLFSKKQYSWLVVIDVQGHIFMALPPPSESFGPWLVYSHASGGIIVNGQTNK